MVKKVEVKKSSPLYGLASANLREKYLEGGEDAVTDDQQKEELENIKKLFEVDNLNETCMFTLKIENFLWGLFENIEVPEAPLRAKAHEKFMQDVATELERTVNEKEELPKLSEKALRKALPFVEEPEKFKALSFNFEFEAAEKKKTLPLPSVNILADSEFLDLINEIFEPVMEEEDG